MVYVLKNMILILLDGDINLMLQLIHMYGFGFLLGGLL